MIVKSLTFLLCVAMTLTNAVCICAADPSKGLPEQHRNVARNGDADCCCGKSAGDHCCGMDGDHDHDVAVKPFTAEFPAQQKSHHCPHCTGTILAMRNARSGIAIASPMQTLAAPFHSTFLTAQNFSSAKPMRAGEPPPHPPDTLLRLACALQI